MKIAVPKEKIVQISGIQNNWLFSSLHKKLVFSTLIGMPWNVETKSWIKILAYYIKCYITGVVLQLISYIHKTEQCDKVEHIYNVAHT